MVASYTDTRVVLYERYESDIKPFKQVNVSISQDVNGPVSC